MSDVREKLLSAAVRVINNRSWQEDRWWPHADDDAYCELYDNEFDRLVRLYAVELGLQPVAG